MPQQDPASIGTPMHPNVPHRLVDRLVDCINLDGRALDAQWRSQFGGRYRGTVCYPAVSAALRQAHAGEIAAGLEAERGLLEKWGAWHAP